MADTNPQIRICHIVYYYLYGLTPAHGNICRKRHSNNRFLYISATVC